MNRAINEIFDRVRNPLERSVFGICAYVGDKIGVASATVRLYFIYVSLLTLGSPLLLYLIGLFWLNIKKYIRRASWMSE